MTGGVGDHLGAVFEMQSFQDLVHVIADGDFAEVQRLADLRVSHSPGNQGQDFELACRQIGRWFFNGICDVL